MIWTAALLGCPRPVRYEPVAFPLAPVHHEDAFVADLPALIEDDLASGRLTGLALGNEPDPGPMPALQDVPTEVLYGLYAAVRPWARGAELDLLVDVGHGPRPVTIWIEPDWSARVAWGQPPVERAPRPAQLTSASWAQALAEEFELDAIRDGDTQWSDAELGDIATALALLTEDELRAMQGIEMVRTAESIKVPTRDLAWFDPRRDPPRIEFFDVAFAQDELGFVGPVDQPRASGTMTALHEVGHVLADAPLRHAYAAYLSAHSAWQADGANGELHTVSKEAYRRYRMLGRNGPVVEAWRDFRGNRSGPTAYGRSAHESFAEAFALYRLDPAALDRALPGATGWFDAQTHLRAAATGTTE